jgi:type IV secretory pathway VirB10-like protein
MAMTSSVRIFIAGVGTTFALLALGFVGGLMLAQGGKDTPARAHVAAPPSLPRVRVILPAMAEAATPKQPSAQTAEAPLAPSSVVPAREVQQAPERDRKAEQAERRKAEPDERVRRNKVAERRAKREARIAMQPQQPQQPTQPAIVAFGSDNDQPRSDGFFGN